MVIIKASLGVEVRKFTVEDDITVGGLRFNIKQLFPLLQNVDLENIGIVYQDSDGDTITLSSDQELRTAISELGDEKVFHVKIRIYHHQQPAHHKDVESGGNLFDAFHSLFDHSPFHLHPAGLHHPPLHHPLMIEHEPTWFQRQRALKLHEEKIRQQRFYEEKMRQARLEQLAALREKALKEQQEMREKAKEERRKSIELQRQASKEGRPLVPQFPPGWQVQSFGSWEPVVEDTEDFTRQSWGPFGYVAYYDPSAGQDKKEEKEEEKPKEEEPKKEEEMEA